MRKTPHKEKLQAGIVNPKCSRADADLLREALARYEAWSRALDGLQTTGRDRLAEMVRLLNEYKDFLEVDLIAKRGSDFLKRQKGQLKLDNSVFEEFLIRLVDRSLLPGLPEIELEVGPQTGFMSLAFVPASMADLAKKPAVEVKVKDQDFAVGKTIYYKFSAESGFDHAKTTAGKLLLAVLAAECKVNLDKTMFQECAGTAARLKQGCPSARYYVLVEYLDMEPEDSRLTAVDNVFLLRHAKRLPFEKRNLYEEVRAQHGASPIDEAVLWRFIQEIQVFISAAWYNPDEALRRGSFI